MAYGVYGHTLNIYKVVVNCSLIIYFHKNEESKNKIIYFAIKLRSDRSMSRIKVLISVLGYVITTASPLCSVRTVRMICLPFWLTTMRLGDAADTAELLKRCSFCPDTAAEPDSLLRPPRDRCGPFKQLSLLPITTEGNGLSFSIEF